MEFLNLLKPLLAYVSNTGISFIGEDDEHWRFVVNQDGEYIETSGDVLYDGQTCDKAECAFQYKGHCQCHKVHWRYPAWTDNKCSEYLLDNRKGNQNVM